MKHADTLPVGVLGRAHGLNGELALRLHNQQGRLLESLRLPMNVRITPAAAAAVDARIEGSSGLGRAAGGTPLAETFVLRACRRAGADVLIRLVGVDTREQASALTGRLVHVPRASLPRLEPGEFYIEDLVGMRALGPDGQDLGVVASSFWNGAHDILTIAGTAGHELMVPVVSAFIDTVDRVARVVRLAQVMDQND